MEKIKSFTIDHNTHAPGFYLSNEAHNIYTYDLRFKWPNRGDYVSIAAMHTVEHLFATVIRNSEIKDKVVYFGPMGCRTGFYLLLLGVQIDEARAATIDAFKACLTLDEVPGSKKEECGNYLEHDLEGAKREIADYLSVLTA